MSPELEPERILRELHERSVRYILIGGMAAEVLGASLTTRDIDICYERSPSNLERLAEALIALGARLRVAGVDEDLPFILDARTLAAGDSFTFVTDAGDVDVLATPSGTGGFDDLTAAAADFEVAGGLVVRVCSLDDLIRMKEASHRLKDEAHLHVLATLREMLDESE